MPVTLEQPIDRGEAFDGLLRTGGGTLWVFRHRETGALTYYGRSRWDGWLGTVVFDEAAGVYGYGTEGVRSRGQE